ncbi:MAG: 50S ribosomal protein L3, partial [Candidatus Binatota bacterium]
LIGKKIGMTQVFGADGIVVPVTVIRTGPCVVVQKKETGRDGYNAVQIGFGNKKNQRVNKPEQGHMVKAGKGAFQVLREFRLQDVGQYEVGQEIKVADIFKAGDRIDVSGTSKGRGFAGVIKRWNFSGFPASHGTHEYFRHGGAIGNRSYPGRVFKGKKMAGHWGNEKVSVQNLEVVGIRPEENMLLVKGAIPGAKRGILIIRRAVKGNK